MMDSLWKLDLDDYDQVAVPPEQILEQQCMHLKKLTEGRVIAQISKYSGPIHSHSYKSLGFAGLAAAMSMPRTVKFERQEVLGDIGDAPDVIENYEFFLTSPSTPRYKFRIMFFSHVSGQYPVDIVLAEDIAIDILSKEDISCAAEEDFKAILIRIISSKKVKQVVKALNKFAKAEGA